VLRVAARGCPRPGAGVADKRSRDQSACGGSVPGGAQSASSERTAGARSERPATGEGSPEPRERARIKWGPYEAPRSEAGVHLSVQREPAGAVLSAGCSLNYPCVPTRIAIPAGPGVFSSLTSVHSLVVRPESGDLAKAAADGTLVGFPRFPRRVSRRVFP